jgi:hypothetical protein
MAKHNGGGTNSDGLPDPFQQFALGNSTEDNVPPQRSQVIDRDPCLGKDSLGTIGTDERQLTAWLLLAGVQL